MGRKVFVVGVGMTKFEKPGSQGLGLPGHGEGGRRARRSPTPASPYDDDRAGRRRLLLRRLHLRPARRLRARPHRHPDLQRQQQLLDRLDRALHGQAVRRGRHRRLRARARLREDGEGLARRQVHRPHQPDGQALQADGRAARLRARRRPRRRCSATPAASTWSATAPRAEQFAKIGGKNHKHSVNNPYSQFQDEYTLEEILDAPMVYEPLTKLQCCPTSDGAGAAILASEDFVKKHGLAGARRSRSPAWR